MEHWLPAMDRHGRVLDGYEVSNLGRVRSYWISGPKEQRGLMAVQRKLVPNGRTGLTVCVRRKQGEMYTYAVHELIASSFFGKRPSAKHMLIHVNHDLHDNRTVNLKWVTRSEASLHAIEGRPRRPLAKMTPEIVRAIRRSTKTAPELAKKYKVGKRAVYDVRWGRTWRDVE